MSVAGILASNLFSNALSQVTQKSAGDFARFGSEIKSGRPTGTDSFINQVQQQMATAAPGSTAVQNLQTSASQPISSTTAVSSGSSPTHLGQNLHPRSGNGAQPDLESQAWQAYSSLQQNSMNSFVGDWMNSANSLSVSA